MVKKMGGGQFNVALRNIENCVAQYGYRPEDVDPQHKGRFTDKDFEMLKPLLERQSYIRTASTWQPGDPDADVDLDKYRAVLYRTFEGNILEAYHRTFDMPFNMNDYDTTWLEADPLTVKPVVITRSLRYRPPNGLEGWSNIINTGLLQDNSIFVGTPAEHKDFIDTFKILVPYYPVNDFLELANIIAGSDLVVCNQGFTYSLAIGLGKSTVLETNKIVPLQMNECFFPRPTCQYF